MNKNGTDHKIWNCRNKVLMVEVGVLTKMSNLVTIEDDSSWTHDLVALLHSLSATATPPFFNLTPEILQFLDQVLNSIQTHKTKQACLVTLHHFSTVLDQATTLVSSSNTIHTLIRLSTNKEASERALATLGNLVVYVAGKQVVEADHNVPNSFIEVLAWENMPKCQELALYILMTLAHGSSIQRAKMARSGIVQVLLGVVLLGSPLAQKRALKILRWFKDEKQRKIGVHSGPQTGVAGLQINGPDIKEGRMVIKKMVKQSLDKNMELIMRRAHVSPDNPKIKSLFQSSSSNSLTY